MSYARRRRRKKKIIMLVYAPKVLGGMELPHIIVDEPIKAIGRTYPVLLFDLTNDPTHQFIKCKLKIVDVKDEKAYTIYAGHEYVREYIRSLFMRGTSYVECIRDVKTKEGYHYRILAGIYTPKRINNSRKKAIRREVFKVIDRWNGKENDVFIRDAITGLIDKEIIVAAKKIYPVRWGGIQKVKLVDYPEKQKVLQLVSPQK